MFCHFLFIFSNAPDKMGKSIGLTISLAYQYAEKRDLKQIKERIATALNIELGRNYEDKKLFAEKLLNKFFDNYHEFLNKGFPLIKDVYIKRCNFLETLVLILKLNRQPFKYVLNLLRTNGASF